MEKRSMTKLFSIIHLQQKNILHTKTTQMKSTKLTFASSHWTKLHFPEMKLIYLSSWKWCPSATIHIWKWDWTSKCTLYNMVGNILAQASVIRFRSFCNVGIGAAYTLCLMYPHRRKSNMFRPGESGDHSTQPPYQMICRWNLSRRFCWTLYTLCRRAPLCCNTNSDDHSPETRVNTG